MVFTVTIGPILNLTAETNTMKNQVTSSHTKIKSMNTIITTLIITNYHVIENGYHNFKVMFKTHFRAKTTLKSYPKSRIKLELNKNADTVTQNRKRKGP